MKMRVITRNDIFGHNYCKSYDIISSLICIINVHMYVQINSCINKLSYVKILISSLIITFITHNTERLWLHFVYHIFIQIRCNSSFNNLCGFSSPTRKSFGNFTVGEFFFYIIVWSDQPQPKGYCVQLWNYKTEFQQKLFYSSKNCLALLQTKTLILISFEPSPAAYGFVTLHALHRIQ